MTKQIEIEDRLRMTEVIDALPWSPTLTSLHEYQCRIQWTLILAIILFTESSHCILYIFRTNFAWTVYSDYILHWLNLHTHLLNQFQLELFIVITFFTHWIFTSYSLEPISAWTVYSDNILHWLNLHTVFFTSFEPLSAWTVYSDHFLHWLNLHTVFFTSLELIYSDDFLHCIFIHRAVFSYNWTHNHYSIRTFGKFGVTLGSVWRRFCVHPLHYCNWHSQLRYFFLLFFYHGGTFYHYILTVEILFMITN